MSGAVKDTRLANEIIRLKMPSYCQLTKACKPRVFEWIDNAELSLNLD